MALRPLTRLLGRLNAPGPSTPFLSRRLALLPISPETRRRWRRRRKVPAVAALALKLLEGELGEISPPWRGWRLDRDGVLISPAGVRWTPPRLLAWGYERQLLEAYRRRLSEPQGVLFPLL